MLLFKTDIILNLLASCWFCVLISIYIDEMTHLVTLTHFQIKVWGHWRLKGNFFWGNLRCGPVKTWNLLLIVAVCITVTKLMLTSGCREDSIMVSPHIYRCTNSSTDIFLCFISTSVYISSWPLTGLIAELLIFKISILHTKSACFISCLTSCLQWLRQLLNSVKVPPSGRQDWMSTKRGSTYKKHPCQ